VAQAGVRICPADPYRRDLLPDPVEAQIELLHLRLQELESRLEVPTPVWQGKDTEVFDLSDDLFTYGGGI
jgi:hypothetical protein